MSSPSTKIIVGISGASGFVYPYTFLKHLRQLPVEIHLVMSKAAQITRRQETNISLQELKQLIDVYHPIEDVGASIASGSFQHHGMVILPCSMKSLAEIALGLSSNLLTRAADVCLKERRKLILMPRETPLHRMHLQHMLTISDMGGIIYPPMPAFYQNPKSIEDMVKHTVGRLFSFLALPQDLNPEWQGWR